MPTLLRLPQDALALWERLPRTQKLVLAFIGALAVGLFAYNFASSQSKPMATLYSSLEAEDAGAITAELDSLGIRHELSAGGTAIQVPADKVDEARIELAQLGLPQGGASPGSAGASTAAIATPSITGAAASAASDGGGASMPSAASSWPSAALKLSTPGWSRRAVPRGRPPSTGSPVSAVSRLIMILSFTPASGRSPGNLPEACCVRRAAS